ncbi:MAG: hypothetical protein BGO25_03255 [Acidobacteriales bacterium 59-55]|nr:MAG: hypothetical protein BGO25_03255 [Acidobacteriales bacterium 59-55]
MNSVRYQRIEVDVSDRTLYPFVLPGTILIVDSERKVVPTNSEDMEETDRPIFVLNTLLGRRCCWCSTDGNGGRWTIIPYEYGESRPPEMFNTEEVQIIGQVVQTMMNLAWCSRVQDS